MDDQFENRPHRAARRCERLSGRRGSLGRPSFLLPCVEKVARCDSASSRMRGSLPLSPTYHIVIPANAGIQLVSWTLTFVRVTKQVGTSPTLRFPPLLYPEAKGRRKLYGICVYSSRAA